MYGIGEGTQRVDAQVYARTDYSPEAESAAFKTLHNLTSAIAQLKEQGLSYASLLPYYKAALDAYRAQGAADPDNLSEFQQFYLEAVEGLKTVGTVASGIGNKVLIAGGLFVVGLYLWQRHK